MICRVPNKFPKKYTGVTEKQWLFLHLILRDQRYQRSKETKERTFAMLISQIFRCFKCFCIMPVKPCLQHTHTRAMHVSHSSHAFIRQLITSPDVHCQWVWREPSQYQTCHNTTQFKCICGLHKLKVSL